jgi:hypothetical protein
VACGLVVFYVLIHVFLSSSGGTRFWIYLMGYDIHIFHYFFIHLLTDNSCTINILL